MMSEEFQYKLVKKKATWQYGWIDDIGKNSIWKNYIYHYINTTMSQIYKKRNR